MAPSTTAGLRAKVKVRHIPSSIKSDDGTIEKTSISNFMVKSKSSRQPETVGPRESSWVHVENRIVDSRGCVYSRAATIDSWFPREGWKVSVQ